MMLLLLLIIVYVSGFFWVNDECDVEDEEQE